VKFRLGIEGQKTEEAELPEMTWKKRVSAKYCENRPGWTDPTVQFYELIKECSVPNMKILEVGAGPTNKTTASLAEMGYVTGLDIDEKVKTNRHCNEAFVYDGINIPCNENSFDLVVLCEVIEHVKHPIKVCREVHRVLRSRGNLAILTQNLWHYYSLAARLTPHCFHRLMYKKVFKAKREPNPTFYRMNTKRKCKSILTKAGFETKTIKIVEGQLEYATISVLLFYSLMAYERMFSRFENLRSDILCIASAIK